MHLITREAEAGGNGKVATVTSARLAEMPAKLEQAALFDKSTSPCRGRQTICFTALVIQR